MTSLLRRNGFGSFNPWRLLEETEAQMREWMETPVGFTPGHRLLGETRTYVPPMDVYETENEVLVFASLPGIDPASVNVEAINGTLVIQGEQKPVFPDGQEKNVRTHLSGIPRHGKFSFAVNLPLEVDWQTAEARYVDGILSIRLNRPETARPIRIPLSSESAAPQIESKRAKAVKS